MRTASMRIQRIDELSEEIASDDDSVVPTSEPGEEDDAETRTIGQSMRLHVTNHRFSNPEGEYDFETGDYVEGVIERVPAGDTSLNSETEVEDALLLENEGNDSNCTPHSESDRNVLVEEVLDEE